MASGSGHGQAEASAEAVLMRERAAPELPLISGGGGALAPEGVKSLSNMRADQPVVNPTAPLRGYPPLKSGEVLLCQVARP